jgi:hypothetical protein
LSHTKKEVKKIMKKALSRTSSERRKALSNTRGERRKTTLSGDRINLVLLAVLQEKTREGETFSDFVRRTREKYASKLGTDRITLEVVG